MAIEAYDTAFPDMRARTEVLIEVVRNPNPPVFQNTFYVETISESSPLGYFVLCVTANDADGDIVSYEMLNNIGIVNNANNVFFVTASGCIYVQADLFITQQDQYSFSVRARDHAFPEKYGTATVQINIVRDRFTPTFGLQNYVITIPETTPINSSLSILTVTATDNDLQDVIVYEAIGDGSALAYFRIDQRGQIFVIGNLRLDSQNQYVVSAHKLQYT